jgi:hypothetical protein
MSHDMIEGDDTERGAGPFITVDQDEDPEQRLPSDVIGLLYCRISSKATQDGSTEFGRRTAVRCKKESWLG